MNINKILLLTIILLASLFLGCITVLDSDKDGYADEVDAFPEDNRYHLDTDKDGYADEVDDDIDNDGYNNEVDAYPTDDRYHRDSDGDGYADEVDAYPTDESYHLDTDGDGYADKIDAYPEDDRYYVDRTSSTPSSTSSTSSTSSAQYYNPRFENDFSYGRCLIGYADCYSASESKANSLARTTASGPTIRSNYDAVIIYLTDLNTGKEYYGEYKITNFYS